jgi:hypothetical protein
MKDNGLQEIVKKLSKPQNAIILFIVLGLVVVFVILIVQRLRPQDSGLVTEDQIRIQKGDKIIFVDKNGLVEYRSSQGVYYEVWDADRILNFFASMEAKAKEYLANPNPDACITGYTVTLYIDGKEQTVCIAQDEELDQVFQELEEGSDISLSDLFDDIFEDDEENGGEIWPTLTPTPLIVSAGEGDEPPGGGGGSGTQIQEILDCSLYEEEVTNRTVISNTLCVVGGPSPTPTP